MMKVNKEERLRKIKNVAISKEGSCLSETYIKGSYKLTFQCKNKHVWQAVPYSTLNGRWCSECIDNHKKDIPYCNKIVNEKNGKCLSTEYINNRTDLLWECENKHVWKACMDNVKSGSWCPYCSSNLSERICRAYFETIFNNKFPKLKPAWCMRARKKRLIEPKFLYRL